MPNVNYKTVIALLGPSVIVVGFFKSTQEALTAKFIKFVKTESNPGRELLKRNAVQIQTGV